MKGVGFPLNLSRWGAALLVVLVLSLALRLYGLGEEGLWLDEGISIRQAKLAPPLIVKDCASSVHLPAYFIALHYWIWAFGDSELAARSLSVIFGVLSVLVAFVLGRRLFDDRVGLLCSMMLGLSVLHVQYSQEARMYSLLVLLGLLSMYFFLHLLEGRVSRWAAVGYVASSTLLIYTHYYGFFILLAQNIYVLATLPRSREAIKRVALRWAPFQAVLLVMFLPWVGISLRQVSVVQSDPSATIPTAGSLLDTIIQFSGSVPLLLSFALLSHPSFLRLERPRAPAGQAPPPGPWHGVRWPFRLRDLRPLYLPIVWLATLVVAPFVISHTPLLIYRTRFVIGASPALYVIVSRGIVGIPLARLRYLAVGLVVVLSAVSVAGYYQGTQKEQWREVAAYVDDNARPGDLVIFNSGLCLENAFDYYSTRADLAKLPFPQNTSEVDGGNIGDLGPHLVGHARVWLVLSHDGDPHGMINEALVRSYSLVSYRTFHGIGLSLYELR